MAAFTFTDAEILAGPVRLTPRAKVVDLSLECAALDVTNFDSDGWTELAAGRASAMVKIAGHYDAAAIETGAVNFDAQLFTELGGSQVPFTISATKADGSVAYIGGIKRGALAVLGNEGDVAPFSTDMWGDGVFGRGALIHPANVLRTSSGTGTAVTLGTVAATRKLVAAIHILAVTADASPQLTVVIQRDDGAGFASPTTVATLGPVSAPDSSLTVVAGPITPDDRYRVSYTISGTNPSMRFAAAVGVTPVIA